MRKSKASGTAGAAALMAGLILSGCTAAPAQEDAVASGISASRLKLYDGLPALVADSQVVVVGEAVAQSTVAGDIGPNGEVFTPPRTETVLTVSDDVEVPEDIDTSTLAAVEAGDVVVRQTGTPDMAETPAALLEVGQSYLLFLTPVDDGGTYTTPTYYIVGSAAGLYRSQGDDLPLIDDAETFVTLNEEGDDLPDEVETTATGETVQLEPAS